MKCISIAIATLCVVLTCTASSALAQEEVQGSGTAGRIPIWVGRHTLGNSSIGQGADGSVNVNASMSVNAGGGTAGVLAIVNSAIDFSFGLHGINNATSGRTNGVVGDVYSPDGSGVVGVNHATTGNGPGVFGLSSATSGFGTGVTGFAASSQGSGVSGVNNAATGSGGAGVNGSANATTGLVWGVIGSVDSNPVNTDAVGIQAGGFNAFRAFSQTCQSLPCTPLAGTAGLFSVGTGGTILVGIAGNPGIPVFRVDSTGKGFFNGGTQTGGADFAESVAVSPGPNHYGPGDLLVLDATADRRLTLANEPYSTLVAGIYSTKPGVLATIHQMGDANFANEVPLAIVGIVPCKVSAENGSIKRGDLLVTSSTPGHAMKGTDRSKMLGAVVGKALEPLAEGKGVIQVLVTLQ